MNAHHTKAEAAPVSGQPTITIHKGGTAEKTIPLAQLDIPDLWHIAQAERDPHCKNMILRCWHYAHDLKRELEERIECHEELVAALKAIVECGGIDCGTYWKVDRDDIAKARAAIADAEGRAQ